jgi:AAA family ATP:ADP antiporter
MGRPTVPSPFAHPAGVVAPERRKSVLDRVLSVVTDVRAGEGVSALLLAANIFFLFVFYSALKIVRDALILSEGGAELGSYSAAGQALVLLVLVPAYGAFASRVDRLRLVCGVTVFFAANLVVFWLLGTAGVRLGVPFYIWTGIFNTVVIAQLWAFANDIYSSERGKRLFSLVNLGASLGAVVGAGATTVIFAGIGAYQLMLIAGAGIVCTLGLTIWVDRRERAAGRDAAGAHADAPLDKRGGFQLVLTDRYLLLIALLILVLNSVNTLGGFLLNTLIREEAITAIVPGATGTAGFTADQITAMRGMIGTMSGTIQTSVNVGSFLFGAFVVSRVMKYLGVTGALFILPLVALGSYSFIAFLPIFSIVSLAKVLENSTDYSINNTARHALFLPTSREAKYKAKQAIDTFFWRSGDLLQAGIVFVGLQLSLSVRSFAAINLVLVGAWLALVVAIAREYRTRTTPDVSKQAA